MSEWKPFFTSVSDGVINELKAKNKEQAAEIQKYNELEALVAIFLHAVDEYTIENDTHREQFDPDDILLFNLFHLREKVRQVITTQG